MSYNILGINPGHNGSAALLVDGELVYYIEEERLSRYKYDGNPFKAIIDIVSKYHIDELIIGGTNPALPQLPWTAEDPYSALVRKFYPQVKITNIANQHHLGHAACAFYNSGFDKALAIIVDGAGSYHQENYDNTTIGGYETESVYLCEYPNIFKVINKTYGDNTGYKVNTNSLEYDSAVTITKAYEAVSQYLGFGFIEAGKTMGLASYGTQDARIPKLFFNTRGSKDVFIPQYPSGALIDQARNPQFSQRHNPKEWHADKTKLTTIETNLAWEIQEQTQRLVGDIIEHSVKETAITKIVIAGGYGLNCVSNYYLAKRFPNLEIYFEPIANDGGTAIGIAKLAWHTRTMDVSKRPQKSIYYGPKYNITTSSIPKNYSISSVDYVDVANLICQGNIIALFQGSSEAGPRALGNRSILYDPRDPNGKDFVNTVKGREWFRPFAGSVLLEDADTWFDLAQQKASPFMMMAVDIRQDKIDLIPAIAHVDNTCRVQTVSKLENKHYYCLIEAFKNLTGIPILFNTSFNLAGDPLVETIDDAITTLNKSNIKYLYLPELSVLVTKN